MILFQKVKPQQTFSYACLALCLAGNVQFVGAEAEAKKTRPNVIVIIADDLGFADMAFLPQAPADVKKFKTPGFDALAKTGTYFSNAYATSPICSTSRAGLITGRYQQRWGAFWYASANLPNTETTLPEVLGKQGYTTFKIGKNHMKGQKDHPCSHGFDAWLGFNGHTWDYIRLHSKDLEAHNKKGKGNGDVGPLTRAVRDESTGEYSNEKVDYTDGFTTRIFTEEAIQFIRKQKDQEKPFYLHISHNAGHHPTYVVDKKWAEVVGVPYVEWDRNASEWKFPYWEPNNETRKSFHSKWGHMEAIDKDGRRRYLSNLLALDHSIAEVLKALEATGQRDNTMIVFTSDNGGTINTYSDNTPLRGYKYMLGDGGIRVPILVSMPGTLPQGKVVDKALVSTMDIFPTVTELVGVKAPDNLDGKTWGPLFKGEAELHHESLMWAITPDKWVMRHGKWKLTNNVGWVHKNFKLLDNGDAVADEDYIYPKAPHLFDMEADIGESNNLIAQHPELVEKMRKMYQAWIEQMPKGKKGNSGKKKVPSKKKGNKEGKKKN